MEAVVQLFKDACKSHRGILVSERLAFPSNGNKFKTYTIESIDSVEVKDMPYMDILIINEGELKIALFNTGFMCNITDNSVTVYNTITQENMTKYTMI